MARQRKASTEALEALHAAVAEALAQRLESQEATAADISAAIRFLKDNNISAVPKPGSKLEEILDKIEEDDISDEEFERIKRECGSGA